MTIKTRLVTSLVLLAVALTATIASGLIALDIAADKTRGIVADRVVPLKQLSHVSGAYAVDIVDTAHKVRAGTVAWADGTKAIDKASAEIARDWAAYLATQLTAEEAKLADKAKAAMTAAAPKVAELKRILAARDDTALVSFINTQLYESIDPIGTPLTELIELQIRVAEEDLAAAETARLWSLGIMAAIALAAIGVLAFAVMVVTRGTVAPLKGMEAAMRRLAGGDLDTTVPSLGKRDEIGAMAQAVQVFKDSALERRRLEAEQQAERAAKERRAAAVDTLITAFDTDMTAILGAVSAAATELEATAATLTSTAEESARNATTVAAAAEQATTNVQTVASASEELATSIGEISEQVQTSRRVAGEAMEAATKTTGTVQEVVASADRIGSVLKLIGDIAAQTNLLALNATIEAARAGEAGRGFAVVAQEVKALAAQTAKATEEVSAHIGEMQSASHQAADVIGTIGQIIGTIAERTVAISAAVEEQGAATREIARNVTQAAQGTREVAATIGGVTAAATQTGGGATQVHSSAEELSHQAALLRQKVEGFFAGIRAA